jgi:hypothetical protein
MKYRECICPLSTPPPSPARADFSIMMECTPEIGNLRSVCTVLSDFYSKSNTNSQETYINSGIAELLVNDCLFLS